LMDGTTLDALMDLDIAEEQRDTDGTVPAAAQQQQSNQFFQPQPAHLAFQQQQQPQMEPAQPSPVFVSSDTTMATEHDSSDDNVFVQADHPVQPQRLPNRRVVSDSAALLTDSLKSWDARLSLSTSVGSAHMSDIEKNPHHGSGHSRGSSGKRRPSGRFSGATLRRATNNFRLSELSMAAEIFEGIDWSESGGADEFAEL